MTKKTSKLSVKTIAPSAKPVGILHKQSKRKGRSVKAMVKKSC